MTDKDKLEKIKKLADDMYYAAGNLGPNVGSGERLRKTMEKYHKFIIHEFNEEEPKNDWLQELHNKLDSLSKEDFDKVWAKYHQKEEPAGDDLEEAAKRYNEEMSWRWEAPRYPHLEAFKAGANWQKQQDQSTIELAEDHAMLAGMEKMKEQMMKDANDVIVKNLDSLSYWDCLTKLKCADKDIVKVICIKKD